MKGVIYRFCGRLFCWRWKWRCDLVNDGRRRLRGDVLILTWNDVGGVLMMLRMSGGRGTSRSRFWSGNSAGIRFFLIKGDLVGEAKGTVAYDVVKVFIQLYNEVWEE